MRSCCQVVSVEAGKDGHCRDAKRTGDLLKLNDVQAPLAGLVLADEGLVFVEGRRHLHLCQAGLVPQLPEQLAQPPVPRGVRQLVHSGSRPHLLRISQNRILSRVATGRVVAGSRPRR